jgi:hypothetical protein
LLCSTLGIVVAGALEIATWPSYAEIVSRDKANLDFQWQPETSNIQGKTLQALIKEILKDLETAMAEFATIESDTRR